jgi:hypothetical protein
VQAQELVSGHVCYRAEAALHPQASAILVDRGLRSVLRQGFVKPTTLPLQAASKQRIRSTVKRLLKGNLPCLRLHPCLSDIKNC